ncbi:MAG: hypothetical protein LAP86_16530 [Acidobacteriia bacterium]|nr:hypothetical protein [Terriglobia bacterium]
MRVLLSTYGSRGYVQPLVGLAVQVRAIGEEVRVCVPPDFAGLLAGVDVSLVSIGQPVLPPVTKAPSSSSDLPPQAAELVAARFDTVAAVAEECDAPVATVMMPTGGW